MPQLDAGCRYLPKHQPGTVPEWCWNGAGIIPEWSQNARSRSRSRSRVYVRNHPGIIPEPFWNQPGIIPAAWGEINAAGAPRQSDQGEGSRARGELRSFNGEPRIEKGEAGYGGLMGGKGAPRSFLRSRLSASCCRMPPAGGLVVGQVVA